MVIGFCAAAIAAQLDFLIQNSVGLLHVNSAPALKNHGL
jgi:hypothetical protein